MLENLQREMAALTNSFSKGQAAAEAAKGQYASMAKGISFAPPPTKGLSAAAAPPSKGFALPPSKGVYLLYNHCLGNGSYRYV